MAFYFVWTVCLMIVHMITKTGATSNYPEQIHLSLGTNETEMLVTWATINSSDDTAQVCYGLDQRRLYQIALPEIVRFKNIVYTYRAMMVNLRPGKVYFYKVGSEKNGWSTIYSFRALMPAGPKWPVALCVFGDLSTVRYNGRSIFPIIRDVDRSLYNVIFHLGNMGTYLYHKNGETGNEFMRDIEKIAARVPYMTCPGNEEEKGNFSHYDARFSMLGDRNRPEPKRPLHERLNNHYHSMNVGPAHIVMFSTEFYYNDQDKIAEQYEFLEQDLRKANKNRAKNPWIIAMGHRSMYCFRRFQDDGCSMLFSERYALRKGVKLNGTKELRYGLEKLFFQQGVDMVMYAHDHFYLRTLPIYDKRIVGIKIADTHQYINPGAPVHIVTGSAGHYYPFHFLSVNDYVAVSIKDYSYTRLTIQDASQLFLQQVNLKGDIMDNLTIFKRYPVPAWLSLSVPLTTQSLALFLWKRPYQVLAVLALLVAVLMLIIYLLINCFNLKEQIKKLKQNYKLPMMKKRNKTPRNKKTSPQDKKQKQKSPATPTTTTTTTRTNKKSSKKRTSTKTRKKSPKSVSTTKSSTISTTTTTAAESNRKRKTANRKRQSSTTSQSNIDSSLSSSAYSESDNLPTKQSAMSVVVGSSTGLNKSKLTNDSKIGSTTAGSYSSD